MKRIWIPVFLAAAAATASGAAKTQPDVVVFVHAGAAANPGVIGLAEGQAEHMFARAGISVVWRQGRPNYRGRAEVIEAVLVDQSDDSFKPGALAFATLGPQSGTRIEIFYNRILGFGRESEVAPVLAHVLAHEITHILEGVERHSPSGVMKAHWDARDFAQMRDSSLPFAAEDLGMIHAWAARHRQTLTASAR